MMTRSLTAVAWLVLGLGAGFVLYWLSLLMLAVAALYPGYAVNTAYFLALAIWLIGAPVSFALYRRREAAFKQNLAIFLAGMLIFHVVTCLDVAIEAPRTILFWPR